MLASGVPLNDFVVGRFPIAALVRQIAADALVKLPYHVHGDRHVRTRLMNEFQGIPIAANFLLGMVSGCVAPANERFEPRYGCGNALQFVGGIGGLDFCNCQQGFQEFRALAFVQLLFTAIFTKRPHNRCLPGAGQVRASK